MFPTGKIICYKIHPLYILPTHVTRDTNVVYRGGGRREGEKNTKMVSKRY